MPRTPSISTTGAAPLNVVTGTTSADSLAGTAANDDVRGLAGDDTLYASGGSDKLDGGDGTDWIDYSSLSGSGIIVNLGDKPYSDVKARSVRKTSLSSSPTTIFSISNIDAVYNQPKYDSFFTVTSDVILTKLTDYHWNNGYGSLPGTISLVNQNGVVLGTWQSVGAPGMNNAPNEYWVVTASIYLPAGTYRVIDSNPTTWANNAASGYRGMSWAEGSYVASVDTVLNVENVRGTNGADTLIGSAGANTLEGLDGDDALDGGAGTDIASYASATAGVTVSLSLTGAQDTIGAGIDTLVGIEGLTGSDHADTLTGNPLQNVIRGGDGDDTINGTAGNDELYGDEGNDTFDFTTDAFKGYAKGVTQIVDGGENDPDKFDLLSLPFSPTDYELKYNNGSWTLKYTPGGITLKLSGIEKLQFSVPINSLLDRDLYTEAAISAVTAYKATPQDQQNIGSWHAVSPLELGLNAESDEFSMLGGVFSCNGLFDKIATVCSGVIDGKKTILITFKGTNLPDVIDLMADLSSSQFQRYYNAFRDLIDAVETYISDNSSDVDRVLISGHSLGGALA